MCVRQIRVNRCVMQVSAEEPFVAKGRFDELQTLRGPQTNV